MRRRHVDVDLDVDVDGDGDLDMDVTCRRHGSSTLDVHVDAAVHVKVNVNVHVTSACTIGPRGSWEPPGTGRGALSQVGGPQQSLGFRVTKDTVRTLEAHLGQRRANVLR
jgi:hypothetical protein